MFHNFQVVVQWRFLGPFWESWLRLSDACALFHLSSNCSMTIPVHCRELWWHLSDVYTGTFYQFCVVVWWRFCGPFGESWLRLADVYALLSTGFILSHQRVGDRSLQHTDLIEPDSRELAHLPPLLDHPRRLGIENRGWYQVYRLPSDPNFLSQKHEKSIEYNISSE